MQVALPMGHPVERNAIGLAVLALAGITATPVDMDSINSLKNISAITVHDSIKSNTLREVRGLQPNMNTQRFVGVTLDSLAIELSSIDRLLEGSVQLTKNNLIGSNKFINNNNLRNTEITSKSIMSFDKRITTKTVEENKNTIITEDPIINEEAIIIEDSKAIEDPIVNKSVIYNESQLNNQGQLDQVKNSVFNNDKINLTVEPNKTLEISNSPEEVVTGELPKNIIDIAFSWEGTPYLWGGNTKDGVDCSGFVKNVYAEIGIDLPRTSYEQFKQGVGIPISKLIPGDLVFFSTNGPGASHVGIYIGNNEFISATRRKVEVRSLNESYWKNAYRGSRRILPS